MCRSVCLSVCLSVLVPKNMSLPDDGHMGRQADGEMLDVQYEEYSFFILILY